MERSPRSRLRDRFGLAAMPRRFTRRRTDCVLVASYSGLEMGSVEWALQICEVFSGESTTINTRYD